MLVETASDSATEDLSCPGEECGGTSGMAGTKGGLRKL